MPEGISGDTASIQGAGTPTSGGSYKRGGRVKKTGPARLHRGELVIRKKGRNRGGRS